MYICEYREVFIHSVVTFVTTYMRAVTAICLVFFPIAYKCKQSRFGNNKIHCV